MRPPTRTNSPITLFALVARFIAAALLVGYEAAVPAAQRGCVDDVYRGFDSRLTVEASARIGRNRAIVVLPGLTVLISDRTQIVVGAVEGLVRWSNGQLYIVDTRTGIVWKISGFDGIGEKPLDLAHARALVSAQRGRAIPVGDSPFLEAVRIVGCKTALGLAAK